MVTKKKGMDDLPYHLRELADDLYSGTQPEAGQKTLYSILTEAAGHIEDANKDRGETRQARKEARQARKEAAGLQGAMRLLRLSLHREEVERARAEREAATLRLERAQLKLAMAEDTSRTGQEFFALYPLHFKDWRRRYDVTPKEEGLTLQERQDVAVINSGVYAGDEEDL